MPRPFRVLCVLIAIVTCVRAPNPALLHTMSSAAWAAVGAGIISAWAAYQLAMAKGENPFEAAASAAYDTARLAAATAGENAASVHIAAQEALDLAVVQSAMDNLSKILQVRHRLVAH